MNSSSDVMQTTGDSASSLGPSASLILSQLAILKFKVGREEDLGSGRSRVVMIGR